MRSRVYFVSDVHLGLDVGDPAERERRFASFLGGLDRQETLAVYLLGDIWDFWYEYRDVVPKEGARVIGRLLDLIDSGVQVYFMPGNHDIWCYRWFEELGIRKISQPYFTEIGGVRFCLCHGDGLGGNMSFGYRLMLKVFHSRVCQALFSSIHPTLAFRMALKWSRSSRRTHDEYVWKGRTEELYRYAEAHLSEADCFVFGHLHVLAEEALPDGRRMFVLDDWMPGGTPYMEFNLVAGSFTSVGGTPKMEM